MSSWSKTQYKTSSLTHRVQAIEAGENKKIDEFVSKVKAKEREKTPEHKREATKTHIIDGVKVREVNKETERTSKQGRSKDSAAETPKRRNSSGRGRGGRTRKRTRD